MTGNEIFKRTAAYDRDAQTIRLHAPHWKLLLAYDGQRSLAEVALSLGISFAEALPLTEKFLGHGWIEEQPITLDQYLKRSGASDLSAIGAAIPPAVVLHAPRSETETPAPASPAPTPAPKPAAEAVKPPPIPVVTPVAVTVAAPTSAPPARGPMRLSAVVDYITSLVGNTTLGRLLVYRVFLHVPADLLQAEDIVSVHLVNDTSMIRTAALQQAIAGAVSEVAKRPLPDGVYAPA